ncbi:hypothetical protein H9Y04_03745 [Streptomyces sp. TRM66268-LWL]|uniref:Secreted protein n=2 Tax=Streptomyces polyasparticus TaxID=2767826 RepID=A0ABR7S897_9ACTN|nr:hypothetical protein [Streptomyces polyasparticus]
MLLSGCLGSIDPDEVPGVYRNDKMGSELRLESDGTFAADNVTTDEQPADFHGTWEHVDNGAIGDFIYLTIEDDGLGLLAGIQLYPSGSDTVEFRPDPDGPPTPELTKVAAL